VTGGAAGTAGGVYLEGGYEMADIITFEKKARKDGSRVLK
jgi:hypothetical protein